MILDVDKASTDDVLGVWRWWEYGILSRVTMGSE